MKNLKELISNNIANINDPMNRGVSSETYAQLATAMAITLVALVIHDALDINKERDKSE